MSNHITEDKMGITERKEREKERRRNEIIDAAERIFFTKGKALATMDDVAEEAELSKGTLYLYFKSKEDLYLAINLRGMKILYDLFADAIKTPKTGLEKVYGIGKAYLQFFTAYPDYYNALMYFDSQDMKIEELHSKISECNIPGQDALEILIEALKIGIKDETIRSDIEPVRTAAILWGVTSGIIQLVSTKGDHLQDDHGINKDDLIESVFDFIKRSLQK